MKDSHGQTVQQAQVVNFSEPCGNCKYRGFDACHHDSHCLWPTAPRTTIVQDYRAYTADEILHGILQFSEQAGWGDPANLGHWLGAAQRWALKAEGR